MSRSSFQQPLSAEWAETAASAHDASGSRTEPRWKVYPELAAAGLWTTPSDLARFVIEIQRALQGSGAVLREPLVREMIAPVGVGPFGAGLPVVQRGEGWYFRYNGANFGYRAHFVAHLRKGYGLVVMSNGENGEAVFQEIEARVAAAYHWDLLDKPQFRN